MEHWLSRAAAMHPDRVALSGEDVAFSYAELQARALGAAGALRERGVSPGDRVALALGSSEELVIAVHGCLLAGAAAVPIDLRLGAAERAPRAGGTATLVDGALAGPPLRGVTGLELDRVAVVMHTSGTTASPRPVELTYGNWLASALGSAVALGLDAHERWLCPMLLVHVGGLSVAIRSAIYGTTAIVHQRFDAERVCAALMDSAQRITLVSLVPTMLSRLLAAGLHDPPTLRWALLGGAPAPAALLARAREAGIPVAASYGMTEACSQIATAGWPLIGVELRIAQDDGEVLVRGPTIAPGSIASDGWLATGDLGELDGRGRLRIAGRKADTIVTGAENVAPLEVESVLLEHPAVADAAVFGRPDTEWGEAVVATVVLRDGFGWEGGVDCVDGGAAGGVGVQELRAHCAARLAGFKVPKAIAFSDRLPRSDGGKLLRRELR